ncbi:MAG TPA: four helix bundle protein [Candidatus Limnocylindria bacterium]|jgi:four helix bundle protein|nr:four helix bundle protein [Candidatus Limnocylindria bacterium]
MSDEIPTSLHANKTKPQGYRDLLVWQRGIELAKVIYQLTAKLPAEERYGLVSQMRRAAVSVPSNLAEGQARKSTAEFIQFISIAEGSIAELDTQVFPSLELRLVKSSDTAQCLELISELRRMLNALRRRLAGDR